MSTGVELNDEGWPFIYFDGYLHVSNDSPVAVDVRIVSSSDSERRRSPIQRIHPGRGVCIPLPRPPGWTRDDGLDEILDPWTLHVGFVGSTLTREYPLSLLDGGEIKYDVFVKEDFTIGNNSMYV